MGFASGLPLALTGATLQIWLTESGCRSTSVGLFSLVGFVYALKFLWSPVIDRAADPVAVGAARPAARVAARAGRCVARPARSSRWARGSDRRPVAHGALAAVVAFLSASQDIVIDAYRIELLGKDEQAAGAASTQWGYRLGMIASGARRARRSASTSAGRAATW